MKNSLKTQYPYLKFIEAELLDYDYIVDHPDFATKLNQLLSDHDFKKRSTYFNHYHLRDLDHLSWRYENVGLQATKVDHFLDPAIYPKLKFIEQVNNKHFVYDANQYWLEHDHGQHTFRFQLESTIANYREDQLLAIISLIEHLENNWYDHLINHNSLKINHKNYLRFYLKYENDHLSILVKNHQNQNVFILNAIIDDDLKQSLINWKLPLAPPKDFDPTLVQKPVLKLSQLKNCHQSDGKNFCEQNPQFANQLNQLLVDLDQDEDFDLLIGKQYYGLEGDQYVVLNDQIRLMTNNPQDLLNEQYYQNLLSLRQTYPLYYEYDINDPSILYDLDTDLKIYLSFAQDLKQFSKQQLANIAHLFKTIHEQLIIENPDPDYRQINESQLKSNWNSAEDPDLVEPSNIIIRLKIDPQNQQLVDMSWENNLALEKDQDLDEIFKKNAPLLKYLKNWNLNQNQNVFKKSAHQNHQKR